MELTPKKVIEAMEEGMNIVGEKYEKGEYFIPELIMAGETMKEGIGILKPYMTEKTRTPLSTVIVATVLGDLHDIGKNIFIMLMTMAGFKVIDLGVDVPSEKIVDTVKASNASIVGLSALLTTNLEQIPQIIERLEKAKLRDQVKVIIGGATVTEQFAKTIKVNSYAKDAVTGVKICKKWVKEK